MNTIENLLQAAVREGLYTNLLFEVYDMRHGALFTAAMGHFPRQGLQPVLSASKWVSASVVMALVDGGALSLDRPVSHWLPTKSQITPRQLLSFTSGLDQMQPAFKDPAISLREAAMRILDTVRYAPGEAFDYGDCHFTVLGAVAEAATGLSWRQLFRDTLADPLGWAPEAAFFAKPGVRKGEANPRPAAGLVVSYSDYLKFLQMVFSLGVWQGKRILREESVREMELDQIGSARLEGSGFRDAGLLAGYGLGVWRELDEQGRCSCVSSPGLFGYYPWLDRQLGMYGMLGAREPLPVMQKALPFLTQVRAAAAQLAL